MSDVTTATASPVTTPLRTLLDIAAVVSTGELERRPHRETRRGPSGHLAPTTHRPEAVVARIAVVLAR